jgi:hypothetical protein
MLVNESGMQKCISQDEQQVAFFLTTKELMTELQI